MLAKNWFPLLFLPFVAQASNSNVAYVYDGIATCSSNSYGISLDSFNIECDGDDGYCKPGGSISGSGTFSAARDFPSEVHASVKACKFWGTLCTPYLLQGDVDVCDELNLQSDYNSCSEAGEYSASQTYTIPTATMSQYAVNGFAFNVYVNFEDDYGEVMSCHAQFHTVNGTSGATTASFAGFAVLAMGVTAYGLRRKKRRSLLTLDDEQNVTTGFEMMGDSRPSAMC